MEDFVPYELVVKLREKGFDWCKITTYNPKTKVRNNHIEPTISQVLKWLREEKRLHVEIWITGKRPIKWHHTIHTLYHSGETQGWSSGESYGSYELAALAAIEYVLDKII